MKVWKIGLLSIDRSRNCAYVYFTQDNPYWSTNLELRLDKIEEMCNCTFKDCEHFKLTLELVFFECLGETLDLVSLLLK